MEDYLTLKWGTLKSCNLTSELGKDLLKQYFERGVCGAETIFLDWSAKDVSKEEAKSYVMGYS